MRLPVKCALAHFFVGFMANETLEDPETLVALDVVVGVLLDRKPDGAGVRSSCSLLAVAMGSACLL